MRLEDAPTVGKIGPRPDGVDAPFWEGLAAGELRMQRCSSCQNWMWPPGWRCSRCGGWELAWEAVPPEGVIYSWTRTWHAFAPELKDVLPYVSLLVELPHAGNRRLLGILVDDEAGLEIGAKVTGLIQPASAKNSGQAVLRWRLTGAGA